MLRHFLDDFMSFVPLQMPQLLNVATMTFAPVRGVWSIVPFPATSRRMEAPVFCFSSRYGTPMIWRKSWTYSRTTWN